jgi:hypothetical protein
MVESEFIKEMIKKAEEWEREKQEKETSQKLALAAWERGLERMRRVHEPGWRTGTDLAGFVGTLQAYFNIPDELCPLMLSHKMQESDRAKKEEKEGN